MLKPKEGEVVDAIVEKIDVLLLLSVKLIFNRTQVFIYLQEIALYLFSRVKSQMILS